MLRAPLSERFTLFEKGCSVTFDGEEEAHPDQSAPPPLVFGRIGVWLCAILHTDFRECPERELRSIPIPRTPMNKPPVDAPDTAGWHHARCRGSRETGVGQKEGILCDLRGREEQGLGPPLP